MSGFLVTDTNSAIKLAFLKDAFFKPGFVSTGQATLYNKVVRTEVVGHITGGHKRRIEEELNYLKDCTFYKDYEVDPFELTTYQIEFSDKKEEISKAGDYVGTKDNDETLLYLAIVNDQILITNEYALTSLAKAMGHKVMCAEDLVLQAFDEKKMSLPDVQTLIDNWKAKGEHVMSDKVTEFKKRGVKFR